MMPPEVAYTIIGVHFVIFMLMLGVMFYAFHRPRVMKFTWRNNLLCSNTNVGSNQLCIESLLSRVICR